MRLLICPVCPTINQRLAVIAESQAVLVRTMAQQTQLLAQLLHVQSAYVMQIGAPLKSEFTGDDTAEQPGEGLP